MKQPRFDKLLSLFQKTEPKVIHMDGKAITYEDFRKKALCTAPATVKDNSLFNINAKDKKLDFMRGIQVFNSCRKFKVHSSIR